MRLRFMNNIRRRQILHLLTGDEKYKNHNGDLSHLSNCFALMGERRK